VFFFCHVYPARVRVVAPCFFRREASEGRLGVQWFSDSAYFSTCRAVYAPPFPPDLFFSLTYTERTCCGSNYTNSYTEPSCSIEVETGGDDSRQAVRSDEAGAGPLPFQIETGRNVVACKTLSAMTEDGTRLTGLKASPLFLTARRLLLSLPSFRDSPFRRPRNLGSLAPAC